MGPNEKQKIEIEKLHRGPLPPLNQAVKADYSDFLGTALICDRNFLNVGLHAGIGAVSCRQSRDRFADFENFLNQVEPRIRFAGQGFIPGGLARRWCIEINGLDLVYSFVASAAFFAP